MNINMYHLIIYTGYITTLTIAQPLLFSYLVK